MAAASTRLTPRARRLPPTVGGTQRTVDTPTRAHPGQFATDELGFEGLSYQSSSRRVDHRLFQPRKHGAARSPVRDAADLQSVLLQPLTHDTPRRHLDARGVAQPLDPLAVRRCAGGRSNEIRPDDTRTPSRLQRAGVVQMVQREPGEDEEVNAASANDRFATAPRTNSRLVNRSRAAAPRRRPFGCVLPSHVQPRQDPAAARPPQFGGDPQATPAAVRVAKGIRCASRG